MKYLTFWDLLKTGRELKECGFSQRLRYIMMDVMRQSNQIKKERNKQ